jgi:plasmid stabilization system protein ParE
MPGGEPEKWVAPFHFHILLYGHYRIAYSVDEDGDVIIVGVFHGALDIERYL